MNSKIRQQMLQDASIMEAIFSKSNTFISWICVVELGAGSCQKEGRFVELVSKELNHLAAILRVYAGGFEFYEVKKKKLLLFFKNTMEILLHF